MHEATKCAAHGKIDADDFGVRESMRMRIHQFPLTRDNSIYVCILAMNLVHFSPRLASARIAGSLESRFKRKKWQNY